MCATSMCASSKGHVVADVAAVAAVGSLCATALAAEDHCVPARDPAASELRHHRCENELRLERMREQNSYFLLVLASSTSSGNVLSREHLIANS